MSRFDLACFRYDGDNKERVRTVAQSRTKKSRHELNVSKLARALSPPDKKQFCTVARVGRATRQLICFAKSELGAKRIAGRFYREMYHDRTVKIISVEKL
jgi:hypothetical protein